MSYRNAIYDGKESTISLFTWDDAGRRITTKVSYEPYLYIEGNGEYESIYGTKLVRKKFKSQYHRYTFIKDSGIKRVFENLPVVQQFLVDAYWKDNENLEFNTHPIKTMFVDIETYSRKYKSSHKVKILKNNQEEYICLSKLLTDTSDYTVWDEEQKEWCASATSCYLKTAFPDVEKADQEITVITVYDSLSNRFTSWGLHPYDNKFPDVDYIHCVNEEQIFKSFIKFIEADFPDILSGWASEYFDIPYIINRCRVVLGDSWVNRLSPTGRIYSRTIKGQFGRTQIKWLIEGISLIDYLDVYKKFTQGLRESYKLDAIGEAELGQKKVDVGNVNLAALFDTNWQTFIDYNIQDVRLLKHLEEKLKFLELLRMLAYTGLTTLESAMGALSVINGATAIRARRRNQIMPTFIRSADTGKNPGAFVGEPLSGFQKNIISFDANSLYPNVMLSLNMSPETKIGIIESKTSDEITIRHVNGKIYKLTVANFSKFINDEQIAISKANVLFTQKYKGVMPAILDEYYDKRVEVKKELTILKHKKAKIEKNSKDADRDNLKQLETKINQLDAKQLCIKIFLNSIYGYFGNKNAPFGDDDIASSITLTGQAVIKASNELLKKYITERTGITNQQELNNSIIYNDTDSYTRDTQIITDEGVYTAEKLWDKHDSSITLTAHGHELKLANFKILSYDKNTKEIEFKRIKKLVRHCVTKRQFLISVNSKQIKMTEDHGCIVLRDNNLIRVSARDIVLKDKMIVLSDLCAAKYEISEVAQVTELEAFKNEYVYDIEMLDNKQPWFFANDILIHNSCYITVKPIIDSTDIKFTDSNGKLTPELYSEVQAIEDYLNKHIKIWGASKLNSKDCRFVFKREMIADVGLFLQKKRYVMHILDDEGIPVNKYKYTGVEVVRSTMPAAIKPYVKNIIETMLQTQDIVATNAVLNKAYKVFNNLAIEDIAFVSGIKNYDNYASKCNGFKTVKGMPCHVKAAYYYNILLKKFNIETEYETINSGDKVRYCYVQKPNKYNISCIAYKYYLPPQFKECFYIDYEVMFEKIIFSAIERFYENVKWSVQKPGSPVQTNLFDLLS
jgi:DNA polymerase elongation subunit (family B)